MSLVAFQNAPPLPNKRLWGSRVHNTKLYDVVVASKQLLRPFKTLPSKDGLVASYSYNGDVTRFLAKLSPIVIRFQTINNALSSNAQSQPCIWTLK